MERYREINIVMGMMFANKTPLLMTIYHDIKFVKYGCIIKKKQDTVIWEINRVKYIYCGRGFRIPYCNADFRI